MGKIILPPADAYKYPYSGYSRKDSNNYYKELSSKNAGGAALRIKLLKRQDFCCAYCLSSLNGKRMNIDHVKPLKLGGNNNPKNLVAACGECNRDKGNSRLGVFGPQLALNLLILKKRPKYRRKNG